MIVGSYTLDLYCDNEPPKGIHEYEEFPHQFIAQTGASCRKQAKRRGWKLQPKYGRAICPKCAVAGVTWKTLITRKEHGNG